MSYVLLMALLATLAAAAAAVAPRKRLLLNPAFYVFLVVGWSVLFKAAYVFVLRSRPNPSGRDAIYLNATSPEFLASGAMLATIAAVTYALGFRLVGSWILPLPSLERWRLSSPHEGDRRIAALLGLLTIVAFVLYLVVSDTPFLGPFSAKRFAPGDIGVSSRFQYPPYYLFKVALSSGSLAYATALLLFRSRDRRNVRLDGALVAVVFSFALFVSHFASLRLFILLVLFQIILLVAYLRPPRRQVALIGVFVLLTGASFGLITVSHRGPAPRVVKEILDESIRPAPASSGRPAGSQQAPDVQPKRSPAPPDRSPPRRRAPSTSKKTDEGDRPHSELATKVARIAAAAFEGRYFMDIAKLAHIADHFPDERSFLIGRVVNGNQSVSRYLAIHVFAEPRNSVPAGFAGELYIHFAWPGLILGFLALGGGHRILLNHLLRGGRSVVTSAVLILLIPNTTLVLLNSGFLPALSRSVVDVTILLLVWRPHLARRMAVNATEIARR